MKLNLTDDKKGVEFPNNEYAIPILLFCTATAFMVNFLLSGNPYYAMGAAIGSLIPPVIVTLFASFLTKKWSTVFGITWIMFFVISTMGQFLVK